MTEAELAEIAQALETYRAATNPCAVRRYRAKLETLLVRHADELLDSAYQVAAKRQNRSPFRRSGRATLSRAKP
jgi:hypothetical protein